MKRPLFIMLVGNIGSGKSTLCKNLAKSNFIIISRDALRYMIGAGSYRFDPKIEKYICEGHDSLLYSFLSAYPDELDVVVDEVNVQSERRYDLVDMVNAIGGYTKVAIVLPKLTKKAAVDRRMKKEHGKFGRKVWEGVWERFDKAYSDPNKDEGFNEVIFLKNKEDVNNVPKKLESIRRKYG